MTSITRYYRELAEGKRNALPDRLLLFLLAPLALCYGTLLGLRATLFAAGFFRTLHLPRPEVSVGNLTVGGTGKTPMVALLARELLARGRKVAVLSRGYGGTLHGRGEHLVSDGARILLAPEEAGDEPVLLARSVPGLMVVIGADRHRAGLLAMERLNPDLFILDDGYQHLRLWRNLNILLLDCRSPFGNGRTFPAGLLREPRSALNRADLVIHTRCREGAEPGEILPGVPSCRGDHQLVGFTPLGEGGEPHPFAELHGLRGVAFAGIADPEAFFSGLVSAGLTLVATLPLPDHCRYQETELAAICRLAREHGADYLITTTKDAVKLFPHRERLGAIHAALMELRLADRRPLEAALEKLL
jgi:tetraacyldisaccharide 4'-kinase